MAKKRKRKNKKNLYTDEWSFIFNIYSNNGSYIKENKIMELFDLVVEWAEKNNYSCIGFFEPVYESKKSSNS